MPPSLQAPVRLEAGAGGDRALKALPPTPDCQGLAGQTPVRQAAVAALAQAQQSRSLSSVLHTHALEAPPLQG